MPERCEIGNQAATVTGPVVPASIRPSRGTAKSQARTLMPADVAKSWQISLSFAACCKSFCLSLASGTRDAKAVGFNQVRRSQPYSDLCCDERESLGPPSVETRRESLCHLACHA